MAFFLGLRGRLDSHANEFLGVLTARLLGVAFAIVERMEAPLDKKTLRREARARRAGMSADVVSRESGAIWARLWTLPFFARAEGVFTYLSVGNEVGTHGLVQDLLAAGRRVYAPVMEEVAAPEWAEIARWEDLVPGPRGILSPTLAARRDEEFGPGCVCLTPGLVFDRSGHRIGQGGGFYDRFLATFPGVSIGLAFDWQVVEGLEPEAHDRAVGWIVTPSRIVDCAAFGRDGME